MNEFIEFNNLSSQRQKPKTLSFNLKLVNFNSLASIASIIFVMLFFFQTNNMQIAKSIIVNKVKNSDLQQYKQSTLSQQAVLSSNDMTLSQVDNHNFPTIATQNNALQGDGKTQTLNNSNKISNENKNGILLEINNPYIIKRSDTTSEIQNGVKIIRSFDFSKK